MTTLLGILKEKLSTCVHFKNICGTKSHQTQGEYGGGRKEIP